MAKRRVVRRSDEVDHAGGPGKEDRESAESSGEDVLERERKREVNVVRESE